MSPQERFMPTNLHGGCHRSLAYAIAIAAAISALVSAASLVSPPAQALPAYARRTGLPCGQCHVNPQGGGRRTAFGRAFARNGHRLLHKRSRTYHRSYRHRSYPYNRGYGMGPGMMGGYGGMGPGMMGSHGR